MADAELVIGLCDRWHKLPEEILGMDAQALRMLGIIQRGHPEREEVD